MPLLPFANAPGSSGGSGSPGGSNTQIQYNNSGSFGGNANLTWNNTNKTQSIISSTSNGVLGSNLLTNQTFNGASWTTTGTWTLTSTTAQHTTGSQGILKTTQYTPSANTYYLVSIGINTPPLPTATALVQVAVGGVTGPNIYGVLQAGTTDVVILTGASPTNVVQVTASSAWGGQISAVNLYQITPLVPALSVYDSSSTGHLDIIQNNIANNISIGANSQIASYQSGTSGNLSLGVNSLRAVQSGSSNLAFGTNALRSTTSGNSNTGVGTQALFSNVNGTNNLAFGFNAMYYNSNGGANTAVGAYSMLSNTTGVNNVALGYEALENATVPSNITAIGNHAIGVPGNPGSYITALGASTFPSLNNGSYMMALGYNADTDGTAGLSYGTVIGAEAFVGQSSSIILGRSYDYYVNVLGGAGVQDTVSIGNVYPTPNQGLNILGGGLSLNYTAVADTNYVALVSDYVIAYTSLSAGRTVTLPDVTGATQAYTSTLQGTIYIIKDQVGSAATHNITITPASGQTIDNASSLVLNANKEGVTLMADGVSNWIVIGQVATSIL